MYNLVENVLPAPSTPPVVTEITISVPEVSAAASTQIVVPVAPSSKAHLLVNYVAKVGGEQPVVTMTIKPMVTGYFTQGYKPSDTSSAAKAGYVFTTTLDATAGNNFYDFDISGLAGPMFMIDIAVASKALGNTTTITYVGY